jgi:hypothetical protein
VQGCHCGQKQVAFKTLDKLAFLEREFSCAEVGWGRAETAGRHHGVWSEGALKKKVLVEQEPAGYSEEELAHPHLRLGKACGVEPVRVKIAVHQGLEHCLCYVRAVVAVVASDREGLLRPLRQIVDDECRGWEGFRTGRGSISTRILLLCCRGSISTRNLLLGCSLWLNGLGSILGCWFARSSRLGGTLGRRNGALGRGGISLGAILLGWKRWFSSTIAASGCTTRGLASRIGEGTLFVVGRRAVGDNDALLRLS